LKLRGLDAPTLRAAWWALRSVRSARRQLNRTGLRNVRLPRVPALPEEAGRGVHAVLRRQPATCLERALVLQRWRAAHGDAQDVVVGVLAPSEGFSAHAWLADEPHDGEGFRELLRVRP
jgi:hypothetical protein